MRKVVIIGAGYVGSMCGLNLVQIGVCDEIVLMDKIEGKAEAQAKDIADATVFMQRVPIVRAGTYSDCDDADIIVNAIGMPRKENQTRLDMLDDSIQMMKDVIDQLKQTKFSGYFVSITNPCDVIVNYAREQLGLPKNKIFGTGTSLDTARLKLTLHHATGIAIPSIQCFALGEHGDSSMVPMSHISFMGKPLLELKKEESDTYGMITEEMLSDRTHQLGMEIVIGKGSTEFGIGAAVADICKAIFYDEKKIIPVSTLLEGEYEEEGIMVGVPAIIGKHGVESIVSLRLTEEEMKKFHASCEVVRSYGKKIK